MNVKVNPLTMEDLRREIERYEQMFGWTPELVREYEAGKLILDEETEEDFIDWLMLLRGLSDVTAHSSRS